MGKNLNRKIEQTPGLGSTEAAKNRKNPADIYKNLIFHFRPRAVKKKTLDFTLTFGLGGMAFVLLLILFATGLLMKVHYLPFPDRAYESVIYLSREVLFGGLIRNIHFWSANILIIVAFLHFLRVFFTSAFHHPRRLNWIIGLGLFIIIMSFNFTGYLLPWNQLSYWAITICAGTMDYVPGIGQWIKSLAGIDTELGASTLSVFYSVHTGWLPALLILVIPFHFWRVRKAGGLVSAGTGRRRDESPDLRVSAMPGLFLRELTVALSLIAIVLLISIFFNAPYGIKANPGLSPDPAKAPWYFLGFQEMLLHFHPFTAVFVIPLLIITGLAVIVRRKYSSGSEGIWLISPTGRKTAAASFIIALLITPPAVFMDEYILDFEGRMPGLLPVISNGLIPLCLVMFIYAAVHFVLKKIYSPGKNEAVQMTFVFFLTAFVILTVTGIWFRGSGMKLAWPG